MQKVNEKATSVDPLEWKFVAAVIVIVLIITTIPYIYGYATTPPDKQFMGIMLDVPDHSQYFSWMRELTYANLASNKMTPETNQPIFFNLLWWGMGRLGNALGIGYAGMYQALRFLATTLFLLLVYRLCGWFFSEVRMRRLAFLVVTFTSGFGWVLVLLKYTVAKGELLFPFDVFIAEGNTFLGILGYPHFIAAALFVFVFDLLLRGEARGGQLRYAVAAGLVALFLGWQHAYDLLSVYSILLAYAILQTLRDRRLPLYLIYSGLIIGLFSWWPALYSVMITSADPVWKQVLAQFVNAGVFTPPLWHLPILLGPAFLLAIMTVILDKSWRLRGMDNNALFLLGWFLVTFGLVYLPVDYQIHLINGWQVPIAFIATRGLHHYIIPAATQWFQKTRRPWSTEAVQRGLAVALVVVILPTNIYLWAWRFIDLSRHDYPYYLSKDETAALAWLEANAHPDDVVLSSLTVGQYIPALTGAHAFLAHWAQTLDFFDKSAMVDAFFNGVTTDVERKRILERFSVDYVLYGPAERALGTYTPAAVDFLKLTFSTPRVMVYAVEYEHR